MLSLKKKYARISKASENPKTIEEGGDMMNQNEQRIALAEWMGWSQLKDYSEGLMLPPLTHVKGYPPRNAIIGRKEEIPDFPRDLNAVHALEEKIFGTASWNEYYRWLVYCFEERRIPIWARIIHATAAERCEALCRTLWEERFAVKAQ